MCIREENDMKDVPPPAFKPRTFDFDNMGILNDSAPIFGTTLGTLNKLIAAGFRKRFSEIEAARARRAADTPSDESE
jgi:hypothetical protein